MERKKNEYIEKEYDKYNGRNNLGVLVSCNCDRVMIEYMIVFFVLMYNKSWVRNKNYF